MTHLPHITAGYDTLIHQSQKFEHQEFIPDSKTITVATVMALLESIKYIVQILVQLISFSEADLSFKTTTPFKRKETNNWNLLENVQINQKCWNIPLEYRIFHGRRSWANRLEGALHLALKLKGFLFEQGANNDRDICRVLECYHPDYRRCYSSVEHRAANGTSCGHKKVENDK